MLALALVRGAETDAMHCRLSVAHGIVVVDQKVAAVLGKAYCGEQSDDSKDHNNSSHLLSFFVLIVDWILVPLGNEG